MVRPYFWRHHACQTQAPEDAELELIWKPSPLELAFTEQHAILQSPKEGKQPIGLVSIDTYEQKQPAWHDNPKAAKGVNIHWW